MSLSESSPELALNVFETSDGSHSIFSERFQDSYHSSYGAIQESLHIYIEAGLVYQSQITKHIKILELGFGTGLNCLLTRQFCELNPSIQIEYDSYELYPLEADTIAQLNYGKYIDEEWFRQLHSLPWNTTQQFASNLRVRKIPQSIETLHLQNHYQLIFFDAFAPDRQPNLWERPLIEKIGRAATRDAVLVTYCCQGKFQRTLLGAGFKLEKLPGPPGKREILRGIKS